MERPVIATRHGGALDIMREGVTGWLLDPGDTGRLAALLVQASRAKLAVLREYVLKNFSLDAMVEQDIAIYREVLDAPCVTPTLS